MARTSKLLAIATVLFALHSQALALLTWKDYDGFKKTGTALDFLNEPYGSGDTTYDLGFQGSFNILNDGFDPLAHFITGAKVGFSFADDGNDAGEWVDITLDSTKIWNDLEVDGSHPATNFDWHVKDISGIGILMGSLQADGKLAYTVRLQQKLSDSSHSREDVYLKEAKLVAWGDVRRVPDSGTTLLLLGLGLLSIGATSRLLPTRTTVP
ncbi:MAG: VPDSG-CTERM sorting domain-containing protein [Opitutaceae bacterium]